jgi:hypothetical protein
MIGEPWRRYLWIFSRHRELDNETYYKLEDIARHHGYMLKLNPLIRTKQQGCPFYSTNNSENLDLGASRQMPIDGDHFPIRVQNP